MPRATYLPPGKMTVSANDALASLAGTGAGSVRGDRVGVVPLLNASAALYALAGLAARVFLARHARANLTARP